MRRPTVTKVRRYNWFDGDDRTDGIGLATKHGVKLHMTFDEAIQVANSIVDTVEGTKP